MIILDPNSARRKRLAVLEADLAGINLAIVGNTNGDSLSVLYQQQDRLEDDIEKLKNQIKLGISN